MFPLYPKKKKLSETFSSTGLVCLEWQNHCFLTVREWFILFWEENMREHDKIRLHGYRCLHKLLRHFQAATSGKLILVLTELWILPMHHLIRLWSFEVLMEVLCIFWSEGEGEGVDSSTLQILWKLIVTLFCWWGWSPQALS